MKTTLLLFCSLLVATASSFATTHIVNVSDNVFTPASGLTVHPGDTVKWVWAAGSAAHTTTSTSVPPGATNWDHTLDASGTSFIYVPSVPGTYQYDCTFHASLGMAGSFTVTNPAGVASVSGPLVCNAFPNPASGSLHLQFSNTGTPVSVTLTDMSGKEARMEYMTGQNITLDVNTVPNGTYIINAIQDGKFYKQKVEIIH